MKRFIRILAVMAVCLVLSLSAASFAAQKGAKPAKRAAKPTASQSAKKQPKRPTKKGAAQKQAEVKKTGDEQAGNKQTEIKQPNGGDNISMKDIYGLKPAAAPDDEEFKATPVELPEKMHVGAEEDPLTADLGGGVSLNPIPRMNND